MPSRYSVRAMKPLHALAPLLLPLCACHGADTPPEEATLHANAAEWRPYAIEGIAPLMSERDVTAELARRNYKPEPCAEPAATPGGGAAKQSTASCYRRDGRWLLFLNFEGTGPNRPLTWVRLHDQRSVFASRETNLAASRRLAEALTRRFGPADAIERTAFTTYYWYVPRGIEQRARGRLHDSVSVTVAPKPDVNVTLSGWAPPSGTQ